MNSQEFKRIIRTFADNPDDIEYTKNEVIFEVREEIRKALEDENIESRPLWKPMHLQPLFKDAPFYGGTISERLFDGGLCLPSSSNLNDVELQRISDKFAQLQ